MIMLGCCAFGLDLKFSSLFRVVALVINARLIIPPIARASAANMAPCTLGLEHELWSHDLLQG